MPTLRLGLGPDKMCSAPQSASSNFRKLLSQLEQEHDREIVMLEQTIAAALGAFEINGRA